ncbi:MAG: hypothetical protein ACFFD1_14385 [Candidatus Thorarchaeota archaeon]
MNPVYVKGFIGIFLVFFISLSGLAINPFVEQYFGFNEKNPLPHQLYSIDFFYHNSSSISTNISSIEINYRGFNSTIISRPDPYFTGVFISRNPLNKDSYIDNDTMWKINIYQGLRYNSYNVAMEYGTYEPGIYVSADYILYEVDLFVRSILNAYNNAQMVNTSSLPYSLNYSNPSDVSAIPDNWVVSYDLFFMNGSSIVINCHADGWINYTFSKCIQWGTTTDGITYCQGGVSLGLPTIKRFGTSFEPVHQVFSQFVQNQVHLLKSTN